MKKNFEVYEYITIDELAERWKRNKFTIYKIKDKYKDFPTQYKLAGGKSKILFKIKEVIKFEEKYMKS
ncbi:MAG: hypothetical protein IJ077_08660 [Eubacterium sp.]|nr:hypothetical protein [Alphaproteobacteria bacterium]MBQ8981664.1 hypothetical protein [Eubacterium sp.]